MERLGRINAQKKGPRDLVTEADFASQELVRRTVLGAFPDHAFLGEETTKHPAKPRRDERSEYRWIVDPLDGTTNYVHQVPHFSVSLALENAGKLLVGCIFNPTSGECFTAAAGEGAWLNGEPIRASGVAELSEALASAGFPPLATAGAPDVKLFLTGLSSFQAIRRTGSAALNMAYVACGRFDIAWGLSTKIWDVAAGAILIQEAGGHIAAPNGGEFDLESGRFLAAASRPLLDQLLELAAQAGI